MMQCKIDWSIDETSWRDYFSRISYTNILQSAAYGRVMHAGMAQKPKRGLILIEGTPAGLVQVLESSLFWKAIHAVILDRGPLWFDGYGGAAHVSAFFKTFNAEYPSRFGRKRRILPEIEGGPAIEKILTQCGLRRYEASKPYETIWLDLMQSEEILKENMRKNWRGSLNKAEREDIAVEWDDSLQSLPWLLETYKSDQSQRGYNGLSPDLLKRLIVEFSATGDCLIGLARHNGAIISFIVLFKHGQSATYQIGWSGDEGRKKCANHLLLWRALPMLQRYGVTNFDCGGVNDETAKGIKEFKQGLGGRLVRLVGHYT